MVPGDLISHYRILEKLGEGGMGSVWKAEDVHMQRVVALKFLHASNDLPRLLREAQTAAAATAAVLLRLKLAGKSYSSLAVLPMANLSGDTEQEWFSDGMTDTLISELSKIRALRVISRTSVMQYKKQPKPLKTIANELDVEVVVEGSARKAGDRVHISANLIDASTERHLWSNDYDRETGDVTTLHRELARAIAREVRATLTASEEKTLTPARKARPEAVEAYLKGMHLRNKGPQHLPEQLKLARDAVRLDPEYALAHWLLARTLQSLGDYARAPYPEVVPEARAEIKRALELEPDLAIAYQLLSWSLLTADLDWEGAEEAARKAEELDPSSNSSGVHFAKGRLEQALEENREELRRDPLNVNTTAEVGRNLAALGRYEEALPWCRKALAIEPENSYALGALRAIAFLAGRYDESVDAAVKESPPGERETLRAAYRTGGWTVFWKERLRVFTSRPNQTAQQIARARMLHGIMVKDDEMALDALEALEKMGDAWMGQLTAGNFHPIRNHPRFKALLKRLRYPESMWR